MSLKFERQFAQHLFNPRHLQEICQADQSYFEQFGEVRGKEGRWHVFDDRGASILAVAHTDTVANDVVPFEVVRATGRVVSIALDDRLGCYLLLKLLPRLGLKYDLLLTTGEESGKSSAAAFTPPEGKKYNWMFSFDRRGTGVVLYSYGNNAIESDLRAVGWDIERGSFSDICYLQDLGCRGINFGTGYHNEHSESCSAWLSDVAWNVERMAAFYLKNSEKAYEYTKPKWASSRWSELSGIYDDDDMGGWTLGPKGAWHKKGKKLHVKPAGVKNYARSREHCLKGVVNDNANGGPQQWIINQHYKDLDRNGKCWACGTTKSEEERLLIAEVEAEDKAEQQSLVLPPNCERCSAPTACLAVGRLDGLFCVPCATYLSGQGHGEILTPENQNLTHPLD